MSNRIYTFREKINDLKIVTLMIGSGFVLYFLVNMEITSAFISYASFYIFADWQEKYLLEDLRQIYRI